MARNLQRSERGTKGAETERGGAVRGRRQNVTDGEGRGENAEGR